MSKALQHALASGLVERDVAGLTSTPTVTHAHTEPWNADEARRFLASTREDDLWPSYALATNDIYGGYLEDSRRQASAIMDRVLAGVAER